MDRAQQTFERLFGPEFGHGKTLGLDALRAALQALGDPQDKLPPVIHVAGTNGKGSTIAFMSAMAWAGGYTVHSFTKPHLHALNERFTLTRERDGAMYAGPADDGMLITYAERVAAVGPNLTQFDAQVCVALLMFSEHPADLVLLETGMGGRDDSTNVIGTPALAVITPIALDHADVLGPTLQAIAGHKAGIIKTGGNAITARQPADVMEILEAQAERVGATLYACGRDWDAYESNGLLVVQTESGVEDFPPPNLAGRHQYDNAGLAATSLMLLNLLGPGASSGVMLAIHPARLQPLTRGPFSAPIRALGGEVWVDGGHNAHGAAALREALNAMQKRRNAPVVAIIGMQARKDAEAFVAALSSAVDQFIAVPLNERSAGLKTRSDDGVAEDAGLKTRAPFYVEPALIAAHARRFDITVSEAPSLAAAMQNAAQLPAPRVLITGSFLLAADALRLEAGEDAGGPS